MNTDDDIDKLRLNSRIKHLILNDYLPVWAGILGKWNKKINYFDCYAGPGRYLWNGKFVEGSPIISIKTSIELLKSDWPTKPGRMNLIFIKKDREQIRKLESEISKIGDIPKTIHIDISGDESEQVVADLLSEDLAPTFFFIDPYEHPFSLELMNKIMRIEKTEIMVNFMYYQIIRDIENPMKKQRCLKLFAPDNAKKLNLKTGGKFDEDKILGYLHDRIGSKYYIPFKVYFGPDEKVGSGKLKYLLIHYSNNHKAFDLMLNIMWKHSEKSKPLMVSNRFPLLIPLKDISELKASILSKYKAGERITFNDIVEQNWQWYFREMHFREVLKNLKKEKIIEVEMVTSKTERGLSGEDVVIFARQREERYEKGLSKNTAI